MAHDLSSLDDLREAPYNPRAITAEALRGLQSSLHTFGDISGIVWNQRTGHLVCGHQRLAALKARYGDDVQFDDTTSSVFVRGQRVAFRVRVVDWDEPTEKMANVAANSQAIAGEFTTDLGPLLDELSYLPGYDDLRLDELRMPEDVEPPGLELKAGTFIGPELQAKWGTALGQVWNIPSGTGSGTHRLMCGDCDYYETLDTLTQGETMDVILADPPYGIALDCDFAGKMGQFVGLAPRNTYPNVHGDDKPFDPAFLLGLDVPTILWGANYYADKLPPMSGWLVWDKERPDNFSQSTCELAWTNCVLGVRRICHQWHGCLTASERGERYHPTQKPAALMVWALSLRWTEGFHKVLDPYSGSGPVMVAAERLGRVCYGMEIEPMYVAITLERMTGMGLRPVLFEGG